MEVAPGIHRIEAPFGERTLCMFLVRGDARVVLLDTGIAETPGRTIAPYLSGLGLVPADLDLVIVSHADADHGGGNAELRRLGFSGLVACHREDRREIEDVEALIAERYGEFEGPHALDMGDDFRAWVRENVGPTPVAVELVGGERLRLGGIELDVLHTPGHSRGHLTLFEPVSRTAIIADAVLGRSIPDVDGRPSMPPTYRYVAPYLATIAQLDAMEIDVLLTSHFPPFVGRAAVRAFLADSRRFVEDVDAALRPTLEPGDPLSLAELVDALPASLGGWPPTSQAFAVSPVAGHVERLVDEGSLMPANDARPVRFRRA